MKFYSEEEVREQLAPKAFADRDRQTDAAGLPRENGLHFTPDGQYFLADAEGYGAATHHARFTSYFPKDQRKVYTIERVDARRITSRPDGIEGLTKPLLQALAQRLGINTTGTVAELRASVSQALLGRNIAIDQPIEQIEAAIDALTQPTA